MLHGGTLTVHKIEKNGSSLVVFPLFFFLLRLLFSIIDLAADSDWDNVQGRPRAIKIGHSLVAGSESLASILGFNTVVSLIDVVIIRLFLAVW